MVVACSGVLLTSANFNSVGFGSGTPKNPRLHPHFFRNRQRTARKRSKPVWHVLFGTPCWTPLVRSSGGHICILAFCTRHFHDSFENVVRLRPGGLVVWGVGFIARGRRFDPWCRTLFSNSTWWPENRPNPLQTPMSVAIFTLVRSLARVRLNGAQFHSMARVRAHSLSNLRVTIHSLARVRAFSLRNTPCNFIPWRVSVHFP